MFLEVKNLKEYLIIVIVTNPNAISEIEENKKGEIFQQLQQLVTEQDLPEEEYNKEIEKNR